MNNERKYSAEEVANILKSSGYDSVNKRTINYYAFDKKMFNISEPGKKCFTEAEVDKIRAIRILKAHTNLTLDQIKEAINKHSLEEIQNSCIERTLNMSAAYNYAKTTPIASSVATADSLSNDLGSHAGCSVGGTRSDIYIGDWYFRGVPGGGSAGSCSSHSTRLSKPYTFPEPAPTEANTNNQRTVRINGDITLTVSNNIDSDKLRKIINYLNEV